VEKGRTASVAVLRQGRTASFSLNKVFLTSDGRLSSGVYCNTGILAQTGACLYETSGVDVEKRLWEVRQGAYSYQAGLCFSGRFRRLSH
jgi:hypothetical protein